MGGNMDGPGSGANNPMISIGGGREIIGHLGAAACRSMPLIAHRL
jgi:hypothetical protein